MKRLLMISCALLLATCASTDDYDRPVPQRAPRGERIAGGLEIMPPPDWWRDDRIANTVNLRGEQISALDKIGADQGEPITKLQRDSAVAVREIRETLDADPVRSDDIIAAGDRLRTLRDTLFDRQVRMIAAERAVLSRDQWQRLQDAMQERPDRDRMNRAPMGGRGRGGWGGRRPGWPGGF